MVLPVYLPFLFDTFKIIFHQRKYESDQVTVKQIIAAVNKLSQKYKNLVKDWVMLNKSGKENKYYLLLKILAMVFPSISIFSIVSNNEESVRLRLSLSPAYDCTGKTRIKLFS